MGSTRSSRPSRALILSPEEAAAIPRRRHRDMADRAQPLSAMAWTGAALTALVLFAVLGPLLAVALGG